MPVYRQVGLIPQKRHVVFRQENGNLYHEELFGTEGFAGLSSLVYHLYPPTRVKEIGKPYSVRPKVMVEDNLQARSYLTFDAAPEEDYLDSRKTMFVNDDMTIGIAAPKNSMKNYFYKNADADEMLFVHSVLTYDADIIETVFHRHFKDYKYKEYINNSANKWYLLPLDIIKKHVDHLANVFNVGNIHLEHITNELNNLI